MLHTLSFARTAAIAAGFLILPVFTPDARLRSQGAGTDLKISNIRVEPGPVLSETRTLYIGYDFSFSYPARLYLCVQPQENWQGTFMGCPQKDAGENDIYATIKSAGPQKLKRVRVLAMDEDYRVVHEQWVPVDVEFVEETGYAKMREQGAGTKILSVAFTPASPARLNSNQKLNIRVTYEVPDGAPVSVWARPTNSCDCIYEGVATEPQRAEDTPGSQRTVVRWIKAAAGAHIQKVKVLLSNRAGVRLAEEYIDVDFRFGPESGP